MLWKILPLSLLVVSAPVEAPKTATVDLTPQAFHMGERIAQRAGEVSPLIVMNVKAPDLPNGILCESHVSIPTIRSLPVMPEKPKPTKPPFVININGVDKGFKQGPWRGPCGASWYCQGSYAAWANHRQYFRWHGWSDWHRFSRYKDIVPTFAHKSMKFGTLVLFEYRGRRVIGLCTDRGPFVFGRDFDFNPCLRKALGFNGVCRARDGALRYALLQETK